MKTHCCWCGAPFGEYQGFYFCSNPRTDCRQRQAELSLTFSHPRTGEAHLFYVPLPKQVQLERKPVRYLLGGGAAGVTKSHFARHAIYRRLFQVPCFEALLLRRTWNELEKHQLRLMEREAAQMQRLKLPVSFSMTNREFRVHHPEGDSVCEGGHMEHPEDIERYLSRERDNITLDEGVTFDPHNVLELSTRARSTKRQVAAFARRLWRIPASVADRDIPGGGATFWVVTNPGGPAAPMLRDFFIDHTPDFDEYPQLAGTDTEGRPFYDPKEWGYVPGNLEDNPYLPSSYERDLAVLPPWRYQQLRFNNWDIVSGQFFATFDSRVHVKDLGTPPGCSWFRSYDWGYSINPGVCHWWAVLPDGRLYVRQEYVHRYALIPEIAGEMHVQTRLLRQQMTYTVADKFSMGVRKEDETGETRGETFRKFGIPMRGTSHAREQGWTRCRELLGLRPDGLPSVVIHPLCRLLIRELSAAVSDPHAPDDVAAMCKQDALASFRYGAMSRPAAHTFRMPPLPRHAVGRLMHETRDRGLRQPFGFR